MIIKRVTQSCERWNVQAAKWSVLFFFPQLCTDRHKRFHPRAAAQTRLCELYETARRFFGNFKSVTARQISLRRFFRAEQWQEEPSRARSGFGSFPQTVFFFPSGASFFSFFLSRRDYGNPPSFYFRLFLSKRNREYSNDYGGRLLVRGTFSARWCATISEGRIQRAPLRSQRGQIFSNSERSRWPAVSV